MLKIFFSFLFLVVVEGGFFDLTDVEDPLALLWHLPPIHKKMSTCNVNGVCMEKAKCILTGGTPIGNCGFIFTCCSYEQACVKISDKKQSYFEVTNLNPAVPNCKYTIKLRNKNVCQVRLDFEELILSPAVLSPSNTMKGPQIYACSDDELRITPDNYGVPRLCGYNSKQHLYIHINQSTDTDKSINIDIKLASRLTTDKHFPKPTWKIKFTQLECPLKKNKFDIFKFKDMDDIADDFNSLAPQGAIQYFTESKGEIRSFGFNPAESAVAEKTSYPYKIYYTMAFKRPSHICGIGFTAKKLNLLSSNEPPSPIPTCHHYLFIPELYKETTTKLEETQTGICSDSDTKQFLSLPPGPLYINFKAMDVDHETTIPLQENQGFQIQYELLSNCANVV